MMNKVTLIGKLVTTPKIEINDAGIRIARFTLATTELYNDNKERTEYHSVVVWKNLIEVVECISKGSILRVEGRLSGAHVVCYKLELLSQTTIEYENDQIYLS